MTTSFDTPGSTSPIAARTLSAERERHRAVLASQGDDAARQRFALPDPASPDHEAALAALEGEIDRASAALDRQDEADDRAQARKQLAESGDDPAPLSNYKLAEAIKQDTPS